VEASVSNNIVHSVLFGSLLVGIGRVILASLLELVVSDLVIVRTS
jgi:hypothetical protein